MLIRIEHRVITECSLILTEPISYERFRSSMATAENLSALRPSSLPAEIFSNIFSSLVLAEIWKALRINARLALKRGQDGK